MSQRSGRFPFVDWDELLAHPKARKKRDFARMLDSPRSEDWVTWNVLRAMQRRPSHEWWPGLVSWVRRNSGDGDGFLARAEAPKIRFWKNVPAPPAYERASRQRMKDSGNACSRNRAKDESPVEGHTEVDVVFDGPGYLVFAEAKLGSDVSLRTKWDPDRNQIVRNIDCVMEQAGARRPYFWMLVRDRNEATAFGDLVERYRVDPLTLAAALGHRRPDGLDRLARSIAVIEWRELLGLLPVAPELSDVMDEIRRRVE